MSHLQGHPPCVAAGRHMCHKQSHRRCIEDGCTNGAGTIWGPLWCPDHDSERLARISSSLESIAKETHR